MSDTTWLTAKQVAEATGNTDKWVYKQVADCVFAARKQGEEIMLIDPEPVARWMLDRIEEAEQRIAHLYQHLPPCGHTAQLEEAMAGARRVMDSFLEHME